MAAGARGEEKKSLLVLVQVAEQSCTLLSASVGNFSLYTGYCSELLADDLFVRFPLHRPERKPVHWSSALF